MVAGKRSSGKGDDAQAARAVSMAWNLFVVVAIAVWPTDSLAQTFGTLICNVKNTGLDGYPYILSVMSYVIGLYFALRSAIFFKRHADNPAQVSIAPGIAHAFAAAALTALPAFVSVIVNSVFVDGLAGGNAAACQAGAVAQAGAGLDVIMTNFVRNIYGPIFMLISIIAFCVGATYIVSALLKGAKAGTDPRAADPKIIVSNLVFGAILMAIATVLPDILKTIFGVDTVSNMSTTTNIIQWSKIAGAGNYAVADKAVRAVLAFVQIIGGIAFLRGWIILKKAVEGGQATIPQGLTHIIAGAMCINMDKMLLILDNTFGTGIIAP